MHRMSLGFGLALCAMVFPAAGFAQRAPDLRNPPGKEWLTIGGDWHNTRYSMLTQINVNNVKNLKGAWVSHLGSGLGQKYSFEGTPLVRRGILYIATGNGDVFAIDGKSGALIWERRSGIEQNISTVCCGWDNRGVAVGDDKVFLGQLDGTFVALDIKRCLSGGLPEFGGAIGSFRRIVQTPGGISMFYDVGQGQGWQRNIVMNGSPHLPPTIRERFGDSRGQWEGDTLVVDVTNFSAKTDAFGARENLRLVERWTRTGPNVPRIRGHDRRSDGVD
jgi:hypothetical protein